ncbi:MAG: hypothetical protein R3D70_06010 [Rhizobiaceae bacterium]
MYTFQYYRSGDSLAPPYQRYIHADGVEVEGVERTDPYTAVFLMEDDGQEFPSGIQRDILAASMSMLGLGISVACHFECPELVIDEPTVWCNPPVIHLYREAGPHPLKPNYSVNEGGQLIGHPGSRFRPGEISILFRGDGPNLMQRLFLSQLLKAGCEPVYYFAFAAA